MAGFIFKPVIFRVYAYLPGAAGGNLTLRPAVFRVNSHAPALPRSVTWLTSPATGAPVPSEVMTAPPAGYLPRKIA